MRVFAISDLHIDYQVNAQWVAQLSAQDHRDDILILAGDVSNSTTLIAWCFEALAGRFRRVHYVPGNHDLWVRRDRPDQNSIDKFHEIHALARDHGIAVTAERYEGLVIAPLLAWYDFSFGEPGGQLKAMWMDFRACRWPEGATMESVAAHFLDMNPDDAQAKDGDAVISFSHFLPRIDVMPAGISAKNRALFPVLGTSALDTHVRRLGARIHVYGHSHVNRSLDIDGVRYINNAYGYPNETRIAAKSLLQIHDTNGPLNGVADE